MKILRSVGTIQLNEGNLMANGLFNLSDSSNDNLSLWFDFETKDELMKLSDNDFIIEAENHFND